MAAKAQQPGMTFAIPTDKPSALDQVIDATLEQLTVSERMEIADLMAKAGVFPSAKDKAKAFAAIEIGRSLGMNHGEALMSIDFGAQGKPSISAQWQASQIRRRGHNYVITEHTENKCTVVLYRKNGKGGFDEMIPVSFSMDEARKIKIHDSQQGKGEATLGGKWNYRSWGKDMLLWYCIRRIVRYYLPEILGGYLDSADTDAQQQADDGVQEGEPMTEERGATAAAELFPEPPKIKRGNATVTNPRGVLADLVAAVSEYDLNEDQRAEVHMWNNALSHDQCPDTTIERFIELATEALRRLEAK